MRPTRTRIVWTVVSVASVVLLQPLGAAPAGAATGDTWNLAQDFAVAPNQANPNPDSHGHAGVWSFVGFRGGAPQLLPNFNPNAFGVAGLEQWQGPVVEGPKDKLPAVGVNATGADQHLGTITWPAGAVRVAPAGRAAVGVVWTCPVDGGFDYSVNFLDLDPGGGNGAAWSVYLDSTLIGSGYYVDGGGGGISSLIFLSQGETLTFLVKPFQGNAAHDSTKLDVTITQVQ
jgi:hypothetical protein